MISILRNGRDIAKALAASSILAFTFVLVMATSAGSAKAQSSQILSKWNSIPSDIKIPYFSSPNWVTPAPVAIQSDPVGAWFMGFDGVAGAPYVGAIMWTPGSGAKMIYGAIFDFYKNNGHQTALGYPSFDEEAANSSCNASSTGAVRQQAFYYPGTGCIRMICWRPGSTWSVAWCAS